MKIFALLFSLLLFAGCGSIVTPAQYYEPANGSGVSRLQISGKMGHMETMVGRIEIVINDEVVINERLPLLFKNTKEFLGTYQGQPVVTQLSKVYEGFDSFYEAVVILDGEKAATLRF